MAASRRVSLRNGSDLPAQQIESANLSPVQGRHLEHQQAHRAVQSDARESALTVRVETPELLESLEETLDALPKSIEAFPLLA